MPHAALLLQLSNLAFAPARSSGMVSTTHLSAFLAFGSLHLATWFVPELVSGLIGAHCSSRSLAHVPSSGGSREATRVPNWRSSASVFGARTCHKYWPDLAQLRSGLSPLMFDLHATIRRARTHCRRNSPHRSPDSSRPAAAGSNALVPVRVASATLQPIVCALHTQARADASGRGGSKFVRLVMLGMWMCTAGSFFIVATPDVVGGTLTARQLFLAGVGAYAVAQTLFAIGFSMVRQRATPPPSPPRMLR